MKKWISILILLIPVFLLGQKEDSIKILQLDSEQRKEIYSVTRKTSINPLALDYNQKNKAEFDDIFDTFFYRALENEKLTPLIKEKQNTKEPFFSIETSRYGEKNENLEILLEVALITDFQKYNLGTYKNIIGDRVFQTLTSMINAYISRKNIDNQNKIKLIGEIIGIADANPINGTQYRGEFGRISNFIGWKQINGVKNQSSFSIQPNTSISNLELAFLRAYNIYLIISQNLHFFPILKDEDIELIAIDELQKKGYNWRKVTAKIRLENYYLGEFDELPADVKKIILGK